MDVLKRLFDDSFYNTIMHARLTRSILYSDPVVWNIRYSVCCEGVNTDQVSNKKGNRNHRQCGELYQTFCHVVISLQQLFSLTVIGLQEVHRLAYFCLES